MFVETEGSLESELVERMAFLSLSCGVWTQFHLWWRKFHSDLTESLSRHTHTHTQKICLLDKCNNNKHIYSIFKSHSGKVSLNSQPLNKEISL